MENQLPNSAVHFNSFSYKKKTKNSIGIRVIRTSRFSRFQFIHH